MEKWLGPQQCDDITLMPKFRRILLIVLASQGFFDTFVNGIG